MDSAEVGKSLLMVIQVRDGDRYGKIVREGEGLIEVFNSMDISVGDILSFDVSNIPSEQEMKDRYVEQGGVSCPVCHSEAIEAFGGLQVDGDAAWCPIYCDACQSTWYDSYTLSGFFNIQIGGTSSE